MLFEQLRLMLVNVKSDSENIKTSLFLEVTLEIEWALFLSLANQRNLLLVYSPNYSRLLNKVDLLSGHQTSWYLNKEMPDFPASSIYFITSRNIA